MPHQQGASQKTIVQQQQCQQQCSNPQHPSLASDFTQLSSCLQQHGNDALIRGLSPWISSAAMLADVAATVAVQHCCQQGSEQHQEQPEAATASPPSPAAACAVSQHPAVDQASQAHAALSKVVDAVGVSDADSSPPLLPPLKRRNSGKRNLHKPWTSTEEETLVKLVDQADFRKAVLNVHRLTAGAWAKIGRHLGRSGASGLQAIKAKYRSLKLQTMGPSPALPASGAGSMEATAQQLDNLLDNEPEASPAVLLNQAEKRSKLTACAAAILGLQSLPDAKGTGKDILAAIADKSELVSHLNWDTNSHGKIRWHSGVLCALSAEKSGMFQKTDKKQGGQIVWCLDSFKAQSELRRHAELCTNIKNAIADLPSL